MSHKLVVRSAQATLGLALGLAGAFVMMCAETHRVQFGGYPRSA